MSVTYGQAYDQVLALFDAAWQPTGYAVLFPDKPGDPPTPDVDGPQPWARVTYEVVAADQNSLGAVGAGGVKFGRQGLVQVQVFTAMGDGNQKAHELVQLVCDAFEGHSTQDVWFLRVFPQRPAMSGPWLMTTVVAEFAFEELK